MFKGVGWELDDYLAFGAENDYYPQLTNGHRLFAYDHRGVAIRAAIAMAQEGDCVVSALATSKLGLILEAVLFGCFGDA
jgi:hypothetical protein